MLSRRVGAIEQNGVIAREVSAVVFEYDQMILLDARVSGIGVGDIDLAGSERRVCDAVVETARLAERQIVSGSQPWPAVGALEKL